MTTHGYELLKSGTWEDRQRVNLSIKREFGTEIFLSWRIMPPNVVSSSGVDYFNSDPNWSMWTAPESVSFDEYGYGNVNIHFPGPLQMALHVEVDGYIQDPHFIWFMRDGVLR